MLTHSVQDIERFASHTVGKYKQYVSISTAPKDSVRAVLLSSGPREVNHCSRGPACDRIRLNGLIFLPKACTARIALSEAVTKTTHPVLYTWSKYDGVKRYTYLTTAFALFTYRVTNPAARGLAQGGSAHGLGTAAIVDETTSFAFSAVAMALTATASTVLVSIPAVRTALLTVALGSSGLVATP